MLRIFFTFLFFICANAAFCADVKSDSEIWNEGVDLYSSGDYTNALSVLRGLMLSQTHGARAAELVAKLEYDAARQEGQQNVLAKLEEAAAAAQIALRSSSGDARAERNFSLAVSEIPQLRERKHIEDVLARTKGKPPAAMLKSAMEDTRRIIKGVSKIKEQSVADPVGAVASADDYAERLAALSDVWIAVKEAVCQAVTNEAEAAEISQRVDLMRGKTKEAGELASDLNPDAAYPLAEIEEEFTSFHKAFVLPPDAMQTGLECQSNACGGVEAECGRPWQNEALAYTRSFRAKFPAWAKAYEQAAAADTNKPPFTVEAQQKISALSTELEKLQIESVEKPDGEKQSKAASIAEEIIKLLPKDGKGGNSQQQSGQNNSDQDKNRNDDQQNNSQQPFDEPQGGEDDKDKKQEEKKDSQSDDKNREEKQLVDFLKRAQERSDEHEADKKARARKVRLPPNERDW